jgi:hypothetical protein
MTDMQAIETHYAGYRFRSRLEARWAVLFDAAEIEWQYEPQGYLVDVAGLKRPYLPDFWLPGVRSGIWCEVKGSPEGLDVPLLAYAAHPEHGLPADLSGSRSHLRKAHRLLILGPIPDQGSPLVTPLHCCLTWDATHPATTGVYAEAALFAGGALLGTDLTGPVLGEDGTLYADKQYLWEKICGGIGVAHMRPLYEIARKARFEHGERPDAA